MGLDWENGGYGQLKDNLSGKLSSKSPGEFELSKWKYVALSISMQLPLLVQ